MNNLLKTLAIVIALTSITSGQALFSAEGLIRTLTHEKTKSILTIEIDSEDPSKGKITRVTGGEEDTEGFFKDRKVNIQCIVPGAIGTPNLADTNYLGAIEIDDQTCHVFLTEEEDE